MSFFCCFLYESESVSFFLSSWKEDHERWYITTTSSCASIWGTIQGWIHKSKREMCRGCCVKRFLRYFLLSLNGAFFKFGWLQTKGIEGHECLSFNVCVYSLVWGFVCNSKFSSPFTFHHHSSLTLLLPSFLPPLQTALRLSCLIIISVCWSSFGWRSFLSRYFFGS